MNPSKPLAVAILAAGKGTRMKNPDKPKVLFAIHDTPMIDSVVQEALALSPREVVVIVGYLKEQVMTHLTEVFGEKVRFAHQDEQLGTGHAVMQTQEPLQNFQGDVLILSGDVPLLKSTTLQQFQELHATKNAAVSVLTVDAPDPTGYGRIIRNSDGDFLKIVEQKDASMEQQQVREINTGIYLVDSDKLFSALSRISSENAQNEYYLTDIIDILRNDGDTVAGCKIDAYDEVQGVNTIEQLQAIEATVSQ
jgi:UDP-N-acetylglucosamine diphosphorylase/glucosamine-1-phosphate N-acetyltransferase